MDTFWPLYRLLKKLSDIPFGIYHIAHTARVDQHQNRIIEKIIQEKFPNLVVANGPFMGMKYPHARSVEGSLLPKLLGSYELELKDVIETILFKDYTDIVNIGCAEGYYAVGLGMKFPKANIFAFDSNSSARNFCNEMGRLNGVENRLHVGDFCDEETMLSLNFRGKALVVSDCEGFEKYLFTEKVVDFLANHDVLIETHDLIDIEISSLLRKRFCNTHDILTIKSVDDIEKVNHYRFSEIENYDTQLKRLILCEKRGSIMEWLYMTSKQS